MWKTPFTNPWIETFVCLCRGRFRPHAASLRKLCKACAGAVPTGPRKSVQTGAGASKNVQRLHKICERVRLRRDYHQSFVQPDFRAQKKKGLLWRFSAYFSVFKAEKGPKKSAPTLVTSGMRTRVSPVKVLPKIHTDLTRAASENVSPQALRAIF